MWLLLFPSIPKTPGLRVGRWMTLLLFLPLAGCACGHYGTLIARRTLTPTAEVVKVSGCGLLLRPADADAGLSLGYRQATYIYPRLPEDTRPAGDSIFWGWAPVRAELPFFVGTRTAGIELQNVAGFSMLHAGLVDQSFCFVARVDESVRGSFSYRRTEPEHTILTLFREPTPALSTNP